jgi:hypothetical protein
MPTITGPIRDTQGNLVPGAQVTLTYTRELVGYDGGAVAKNVRVFTADSFGVVAMAGVVPGYYAITVSMPKSSDTEIARVLMRGVGTALATDAMTLEAFLADSTIGEITPTVLQQAIDAKNDAEAAVAVLEGAAYQAGRTVSTVRLQADYPIGYDPGNADWIQVHLNGKKLENPLHYTLTYPDGVPSVTLAVAPEFSGQRLEIAGVQALAYDPDVNRVENLRTRAALVSHIDSEGAVSGQIYSDGRVFYFGSGLNVIPDLPGLSPIGPLTSQHLGIPSDGTEAGPAIAAALASFTDLTFVAGTYRVSQTLRPQSGTTIRYEPGAEFICSLTTGNPLFCNLEAGDTTTTEYNGRGNYRFIGPGKFRTVNGTSGRLQVYGLCHGAGFEIDGQGGAVVSGFDNRHGIEMNACRDWRIRGYRFADQVIPATNRNLYECIQYDQSSDTSYFPYAPGASDSTVCQDFEISDCEFENVGTAYGAHHGPALQHLRGSIHHNRIRNTWSSPERLRHLGAGCVVHSQTITGTNGTSDGSPRSIVWDCMGGARIGENYQIVAGGGITSSSNDDCVITVRPSDLVLTSVNRGTVFIDPDTNTTFVGAYGTGATPPVTQYIGGIGWIEADQDLQDLESVAFPFYTKLWADGDPALYPVEVAASFEIRKRGGLDTEQTSDLWINVSTDGTTANLQGAMRFDAKTGEVYPMLGMGAGADSPMGRWYPRFSLPELAGDASWTGGLKYLLLGPWGSASFGLSGRLFGGRPENVTTHGRHIAMEISTYWGSTASGTRHVIFQLSSASNVNDQVQLVRLTYSGVEYLALHVNSSAAPQMRSGYFTGSIKGAAFEWVDEDDVSSIAAVVGAGVTVQHGGNNRFFGVTSLTVPGPFDDDTAAAAGGVSVGELYDNGVAVSPVIRRT